MRGEPVQALLPAETLERLRACLARLWPPSEVAWVLEQARVETGTARALRLCRMLSAQAVTLGSTIYAARLPEDPDERAALLAHELTHVRQWGKHPLHQARFLVRYLGGILALLPRVFRTLRHPSAPPATGLWARFLQALHDQMYDPFQGHWAERAAMAVEGQYREHQRHASETSLDACNPGPGV